MPISENDAEKKNAKTRAQRERQAADTQHVQQGAQSPEKSAEVHIDRPIQLEAADFILFCFILPVLGQARIKRNI